MQTLQSPMWYMIHHPRMAVEFLMCFAAFSWSFVTCTCIHPDTEWSDHCYVNVAPDPGGRLHVHHWYWAFLASHYPIFDCLLSSLSQAGYTLQGINISHLGKRKIIFKMPFLGDMLVPWRVVLWWSFWRITEGCWHDKAEKRLDIFVANVIPPIGQ